MQLRLFWFSHSYNDGRGSSASYVLAKDQERAQEMLFKNYGNQFKVWRWVELELEERILLA